MKRKIMKMVMLKKMMKMKKMKKRSEETGKKCLRSRC